MALTLVILAAGMGSRYGGLKQMDTFGPHGEILMEYSVYDALRAGFEKVVFVIRKDFAGEFASLIGSKLEGKIEIAYAYQDLSDLPSDFSLPLERQKPWGTGHAVLAARNDVDGPFAVINADDFYGKDAYQQLADQLKLLQETDKKHFIMGYVLKNVLSEFGTVSRGVCEIDSDGNLISITERKKIAKDGDQIYFQDEFGEKMPLSSETLVSMNMMGFSKSILSMFSTGFETFLKEQGSNLTAEYLMPTVVNDLIHESLASVKVISTNSPWFGVTYQEDKPETLSKISQLIAKGEYPEHLWS